MAIQINGTSGISGVDGSAATPALQGTDSNTGISFGTDTVSINTGGTARATVDSSGRLGVGTASASGKLHVSSGASSALVSADADDLVVENSGNCGVTIASPNSGTGSIRFADPQNNDSGSISYNHNDETLRFATFSTERARIDSSGRLLVGTTSNRTNFALQLEGTSYNQASLSLINNQNTGNSGYLTFGKSRGTALGSNTIVNNGDPLGIIEFSGADGSALHVAAKIEGRVDGTPGANDMPGRIVFSTTADGASSPTERMRIANNGLTSLITTAGCIDVGTTQSAGTSYWLFTGRYGSTAGTAFSGTASIIITSNGNVQNTNNSYGAISDIKLKENIVDASSQWDDIKALRPVNYNFKEGQTHTQLGLIAQEVELVSPGLVTESPDRDEDGNDLGTVTKSVNYSVLYMKAVKALQEAMERIESLETRLTALEGGTN